MNLEEFYKPPFEKRIILAEREKFEAQFISRYEKKKILVKDYKKKLDGEYKKRFGMNKWELEKANCMVLKNLKKYQNLIYRTFI